MLYAGEFASLLTAVCWATNALLFTKAGQRVGSATVNLFRLVIAFLAMVGLQLSFFGSLFPVEAGAGRFGWLGTSGLIGYALGDAVLFEALVLLGARLTMLIQTLWPVFAALLAWIFLGQSLGWTKGLAMGITLAGIALVVAERRGATDGSRPRHFVLGVLLALGGALGQAVGFLFSKFGLQGGFSPVSANLIRVTAGLVALSSWQLVRGQLIPNLAKLRDGRAAWLIGAGAISGPVVGVVLSLYAIDHAHHLGVASTLMSLSPVLLMLFAAVRGEERISMATAAGTMISIGGAAALFLL